MRRPIHWLVYSIALLLAACGGTGEDGGADAPEAAGMLRKVRSASELENSLKSSLPAVLSVAQPLPAGPADVFASAGNYTGTYTAEAGVDEFDHSRYDGTHLYVGPFPWSNTQAAREIRILRTNPASGSATQVASIPVEANVQLHGFYVADGRLVMFTSTINYLPYDDFLIAPFRWDPTELEIQVYNVDDPAHPARLLDAKMDGVMVATRRIGDRVYVVSRYSPFVAMDASGNSTLASKSLDDLLPKVTVAGNQQPLVAPSDCYVTNAGEEQGYPVLTTITSFSMQNPSGFSSTCYNEESNGIYASATALYVSQPSGSWMQGGHTRIHKFALGGAAPAYAGSVELQGQAWLGGHDDFRMNEFQGMLRVVTTERMNDVADREDQHLFIVRPKPGALALEVVSTLPNDARPEELGKPNESLYGVRFADDRAYLVTFQRTDPLYVLDLSKPTDPRIAGQLQMPGFSEFLHPVTRDLLLALGMDAGTVKLELFDVSSIAHPHSRGLLTLGAYGAYSEALWERHAFTWMPSDTVDRVAIPLTSYPLGSQGIFDLPETSLHQFEILGKQNAGSASLLAAGVVTPPGRSDQMGYNLATRSYIHGDTVYFVRGSEVWSTSWFAPSQVQGPF